MIKDFFLHYEEIIRSTFYLIRKRHKHPGNKGLCNENIIREFLGELLPDNLKISHGEIIDSNNQCSKQTDIIIVDSTLQPFIKNYAIGPHLFIIEAVTCAGEVKAILGENELNDSLNKCTTFKKLSPKYSNGDQRFTNPLDAARFYDRRPFFIFAFESKISIDKLRSKLVEYYQDIDIADQLDGIFVLDKGTVINFGNGEGAFQFINGATNISTPGFIKYNEKGVIESFVTWMFAVMPVIKAFQNPVMHYLPVQTKKN